MVRVDRLQVVRYIPPVLCQASDEARVDVVQRNVMVAGHDDLRLWQPIKKRTGFQELMCARSLRQVAGNRDQIGTDLAYRSDQRFEKSRVDASKVQVRKMNNCAHRFVC